MLYSGVRFFVTLHTRHMVWPLQVKSVSDAPVRVSGHVSSVVSEECLSLERVASESEILFAFAHWCAHVRAVFGLLMIDA